MLIVFSGRMRNSEKKKRIKSRPTLSHSARVSSSIYSMVQIAFSVAYYHKEPRLQFRGLAKTRVSHLQTSHSSILATKKLEKFPIVKRGIAKISQRHCNSFPCPSEYSLRQLFEQKNRPTDNVLKMLYYVNRKQSKLNRGTTVVKIEIRSFHWF